MALSTNISIQKSRLPRVSIVMPVFDSIKYVGIAVESMLNQSFKDFEFLIIDDGSTDGSTELLQGFAAKDSRIRVICAPHRGYTQCLIEGVNLAAGEYIARMDADDIALPDRLSLQVRYLDDHPQCVAVGGQAVTIDSDGDEISALAVPESHEVIDRQFLSNAGFQLLHPNVTMRRSAVLQVGNYRIEYEPTEDVDLFLRLAEVGQLANVPAVTIKYRLHLKSVSHTRVIKQRDACLRSINDAFRRRGLTGAPASGHAGNPLPTENEIGWSWVRRAFINGNFRTARKHARRLIRKDYLNLTGWKLFIGAEMGKSGRMVRSILNRH